jgi:hypothetical protein
MVHRSLINKLKLTVTTAVVGMASVGIMAAVPSFQIGAVQVGQPKAYADCGYWYKYAEDAIYTTSYACDYYFTHNGWHNVQISGGYGAPTQWWLHRN